MIQSAIAQEKVNFYPNGILNARENVDLRDNVPELYCYKPVNQIHSKVFLIIPGGGYSRVAIAHEGHDVAKRLQKLGYASYVLRYRLPTDSQMIDKRIAPIQDAQMAITYIRRNGESDGVNVGQVGVLGFSAGGHLASTLSTHFGISYIGPIEDGILRPDFSVLVYPVITMLDSITHQGSKRNLIGPLFEESDVARFSNESQVNRDTPSTYLVHAEDDVVVPIANSLLYKKALDLYRIPNELYQYKFGGHGFGLTNKKEDGDWFGDMLEWLEKKSL
ncbi:alpha/beta hydrolase [Sphingobacterium faecale]|nr:alpha/beta hydrolase [Sphingobacterium faecale]